MDRGTSEEDRLIAAFERQLRGEKRILLCNAPRDLGGLKKLTDWQIYCLAAALSLTDAVIGVWKTTYDKLPRHMRETLLHEELKNYDFQHRVHGSMSLSDKRFWSEVMQKYLKKELVDDVPA